MHLFLLLLIKILPLYALIIFGWIAGKKFAVSKEAIGLMLIYLITPLVVFQGVATTPLSMSSLSLPLLIFFLACFFCLVFYVIGKRIWHDGTQNILAFGAGTGNTGYFGIPVALALFGQNVLGLMVLGVLGTILFENTLGFFVTARGSHTTRQALLKLIKLPSLYAFIFGVIFNFARWPMSGDVMTLLQNFKGAYSILGMMMIGLGISAYDGMAKDFKFIGWSFVAKFLAWPLLMGLLIWLDSHFTHFYTSEMYRVMILLSIVPMAANTVTYAAALKVHPQKAALAVLLSTLFALVYVPLVVTLFVR